VDKPDIKWRPGPLVRALLGRFDKPLADLPDGLRPWVVSAFASAHWDTLTPNQRRKRALWWDADQNDQAVEFERAYEIALAKDEAPSAILNKRMKHRDNLARLHDELAHARARMDARRRAPTLSPHSTPGDVTSAEEAPAPPPPRKPTLEEVVAWYVRRVVGHDPKRLPPTRSDDEKAAKEYFTAQGFDGRGIREWVRTAREKKAPDWWKETGAKSHEVYGADRRARPAAE
jgi:hypothetical protein